jgi:two-component system LytT family response regulator
MPPNTYRVVIVDDEPLARRGVRARLRGEPDFVVVGECASGEEAVETIASTVPDLVFLDIEMPGMNGFDVVAGVGATMPPVIFLTAYAQYAVPAFDIAAVDYLLKPLDRDRLARALDRARWLIKARSTQGPIAADAARVPPLERFWVKTHTGVVLVPVDEVDWIAAEGDYARLHTRDRSYLVSDSLTSLEGRLPPTFVRIHRSTIVNHTRVMEVRPHGALDHDVRLNTGTELRLSRTYYRRLIARVRI